MSTPNISDEYIDETNVFHYGEDIEEVFRRDDPFEILAAVEEEFNAPLVHLTWR